MIAQLVVEILSGDRPDFNRAARTFSGQTPHGYMGVVDSDGMNVRATETDIEEVDHSDLGYTAHSGRWRFATNRRVPIVLWTTPPSMVQMFAVEEWLKGRGYNVTGHTQDFNKWRGF